MTTKIIFIFACIYSLSIVATAQKNSPQDSGRLGEVCKRITCCLRKSPASLSIDKLDFETLKKLYTKQTEALAVTQARVARLERMNAQLIAKLEAENKHIKTIVSAATESSNDEEDEDEDLPA